MSKKILFLAAFVALGFGAMQVPFSQLLGAQNLKFSLFDFYGPIAGAFFSSAIGLITVFVMQLINWAWHGFATDAGTIIRFFPMLFALLYFAKKSRWMLLVPAIAMIAFWAHPEGRQAWYYALYWLIPIAAYFFHQKSILLRALGTTFTAHAVGGALWIWIFNMKAALWISLIPIVWKERGMMAIGITVTFYIFNGVLSWLVNKKHISLPFVHLKPQSH
ncbi:MAG: hypothetical protein AAB963_02345 [Patescibacteria group bacterium]